MSRPIEASCFLESNPKGITPVAIGGVIASVTLIVLALLRICGPIGSVGFIAATAGGGVLSLASIGTLIGVAVSNCKQPSKTRPEEPIVVEPPVPLPALSELGKEALEYAQKGIRTLSYLEAYRFPEPVTQQPLNPQIAKLMALCKMTERTFQENLEGAKKDGDPWTDSIVMFMADALIKEVYALTIRMMYEFPALKQRLGCSSYYALVCDSNCYVHQIYNWLSLIYWKMRMKGAKEEWPSEDYAQLFHTEGTKQYAWRKLHAEYCAFIKAYFPEEMYTYVILHPEPDR